MENTIKFVLLRSTNNKSNNLNNKETLKKKENILKALFFFPVFTSSLEKIVVYKIHINK